ncbi:MAG: DEAD/DEAH box helicase, partial [Armatimonadetes bacterium]|nr:DEAD/DEAH box helicase [Armatimonadota bacterium]
GELSRPLPEPLAAALGSQGISQLYTHQCQALEAARAGESLVVATGTASGKTLCYNLPVLEHWLGDPDARALYLFPTKALAQDQLRALLRYRERDARLDPDSGTYDGDTPAAMRTKLRDHGRIILTNPDMLHSGILPQHARWSDFLTKLRYVVVDEVHTYRGIFGSNVANVLLRLRRICEHYGVDPQFICCSATIANPDEHAANLIGRPIRLVDDDGSPRGPRRFVLWNPPITDDHLGRRSSPNVEAQALFCELVRNDVQTICFARARVVAELLYRYSKDALGRISPKLAGAIRAYRGGYLAEERREIEQQLFSGELRGVFSTNALELGIDVGGLDACLIVGYPGSIASVWQQAGRAGRGSDEALVILIASENPIDQYLVSNPEYFFGQSPEHAIIDRQNMHILVGHLRCAVMELPVRIAELERFGEYTAAILDLLEEDGQVRRERDGWVWCGKGYPAADIGLRTMSENTYNIIDTADQSVIGTVDEISAFTLVHEQAIYLHHGETWFVEKLDLAEKNAYVHRIAAEYYTNAVTETKIKLDVTEEEGQFKECRTGFGDVTVTIFTLMFRKVKFYSSDALGFGNLDLPPQPLETSAMWAIPPAAALHLVRDHGRVPAEGMLGIANVLVDIVPLYVLCDYADIGCVVDSGNHGAPSIFIYDRYPGGLGFAHKAYELLSGILEACVFLIHHCPCERGCPSCVGSTARNFVHYDAEGEARERIPDKEAALVILHHLLGLEPYVPKPLEPGERARAEEPPAEVPIKRLPEGVEQKIRKRLRGMRRR